MIKQVELSFACNIYISEVKKTCKALNIAGIAFNIEDGAKDSNGKDLKDYRKLFLIKGSDNFKIYDIVNEIVKENTSKK